MSTPPPRRLLRPRAVRRQQAGRLRSRHLARHLVWLALGCMPAMAQDATLTSGRAWSVVTTFNATTELQRLSGGSGSIQSGTDWVLQAGPGLQITSRSGRVRGSLDANLLGTVHARNTGLNAVTGALALRGQAEVVPGWAYFDAMANVSQQATSAYGQLQSTTGLRGGSDRREVANVMLSPYVRGSVGDWADYELRYTGQGTYVRNATQDNSSSHTGSAALRSRPGPRLGWGVEASTQRVGFNSGRNTQLDRLVGSVHYDIDTDLRVTARAGREGTDVNSVVSQAYATWGGGVRWMPSPRTTLSLDVDQRYFGTGYQLVAEHRFRRAAVRFSSVRSSTSGVDAVGVGQPMSLLQLYMFQYASVEPDPALRELRVRELLRLTNQSPTTMVNGGLATAAVSLQQRSDLSVSLLGARTSATAQAFVSSTRTLDRLSPAPDAGRLRQQGLLLTATHRLTPATNLTLSASHSRNPDPLPLSPSGATTALSLGLTTAINPHMAASLGVRHARDRSGLIPSTRETAVFASVNVRF